MILANNIWWVRGKSQTVYAMTMTRHSRCVYSNKKVRNVFIRLVIYEKIWDAKILQLNVILFLPPKGNGIHHILCILQSNIVISRASVQSCKCKKAQEKKAHSKWKAETKLKLSIMKIVCGVFYFSFLLFCFNMAI